MKFVQPTSIELVSSTISANDADNWDGTVEYSIDDEVMAAEEIYQWGTYTAASEFSLYDGYWNGSLWMVVGYTGSFTGKAMTSTDGQSWTQVTDIGSCAIQGVTYGNGLWVAVGSDDGDVYTSDDDGVTWTNRYTSADHWFAKVAYNGSDLFIAVGKNFTSEPPAILTSSDGITWALDDSSFVSDGSFWGVNYYSGQWVIVGYDTTGATALGLIYTSSDGSAWTKQTHPLDAVHSTLRTPIHNGTYWFVSCNSSTNPAILRSSDGASWTNLESPGGEPEGWKNLAWDGTRLFCAISIGSDNYISISTDDGASWNISNKTSSYLNFISSISGSYTIGGRSSIYYFDPTEYANAADWYYIYKSLQDSNTGNYPATSSSWWYKQQPINKFRMFDNQIVSKSTSSTDITFEVNGNDIDTLALFGLLGSSVRIQLVESGTTIYDLTIDLTAYDKYWLDRETFYDFDNIEEIYQELTTTSSNCTLKVTISKLGSNFVECGKVVIGRTKKIGSTKIEPIVSIIDYSKVEEDEFGNTTIIVRSFAKRAECDVNIYNNKSTAIQRSLSKVRATPTAWRADNDTGLGSLILYGIYEDFRNIIQRKGSSVSMNKLIIRGMI